MVGINQRIRFLREHLKLKTRPFSEKIGYSQGTLSQIELGKTKIERRLIVVICSVFHVREEWLMTGVGEIFQHPEERSEEELLAILREKYDLSDDSLYILRGYLRLNRHDKDILSSIVLKMAAPKSDPEPKKNNDGQAEAENLRRTG